MMGDSMSRARGQTMPPQAARWILGSASRATTAPIAGPSAAMSSQLAARGHQVCRTRRVDRGNWVVKFLPRVLFFCFVVCRCWRTRRQYTPDRARWQVCKWKVCRFASGKFASDVSSCAPRVGGLCNDGQFVPESYAPKDAVRPDARLKGVPGNNRIDSRAANWRFQSPLCPLACCLKIAML